MACTETRAVEKREKIRAESSHGYGLAPSAPKRRAIRITYEVRSQNSTEGFCASVWAQVIRKDFILFMFHLRDPDSSRVASGYQHQAISIISRVFQEKELYLHCTCVSPLRRSHGCREFCPDWRGFQGL